jgi:2,4-dienoyl-CoA reductase-like NADH-dependent reductase (Old Yellow Enzyme family)
MTASLLFEPIRIKGLSLKNRLTMAPLYLGYANPDGTVSDLMVDHYREMAASGVAMVVVENAAVDATGLGSPFVLRADQEQYIAGLARLAQTIKREGALAFLQINHAGRYAFGNKRLAPSPFSTGGVVPAEMTAGDIDRIVSAYAEAARRVKEAGFDGVEIHGGTGYLLVQFLSPRTNLRKDAYGGGLEKRMRFPLRVVEAVTAKVGDDFPVGYRFLADELLPDGLHLQETTPFALELQKRSLAYLSVIAGTYDSFFLPEYLEMEKREGYMVSYAAAIKKACRDVPVIAAGRIETPETAEKVVQEGKADLIGLARVLLADPLWPKKAQGMLKEPVNPCEPTCSFCMKRVMAGRPVYCARWPKERREGFLDRVGERGAEN